MEEYNKEGRLKGIDELDFQDTDLIKNAQIAITDYGIVIKFNEVENGVIIKYFHDGKMEVIDKEGNLIGYSNDRSNWVFPL